MSEEREHWNSRVGFVMAAIGSAVGLGNVWRFPGVCAANGGGAFLIPYFVAILTLGIPLLILEFAIGHMMIHAAPFSFAKMRRNTEWVGWFALLVATVISIYYVVIMAWCCNYMVFSFIPAGGAEAGAHTAAWGQNPSQFFMKDFLQASEGMGQFGGMRLWIVLGLALMWIWIYLSIFKGVGLVGKVVMVTVPLPILLLLVLFFSEIVREGAVVGISQYLTPDFNKLLDPTVWRAAFGQVFFSLTLGFGVMIAYASYLKRKTDVSNNALITAMADSGISFFAGFVVFSTVGHLAVAKGIGLAQIKTTAFGLVFTTYPEAINHLGKWAPLFGLIFFLMLLTLGIDSAFSLVEGAASALVEKTGLRHARVTGILCVACFVLGLIFCTHAGIYWIDWADHICNDVGLPLVMLIQCIVAGWLFGAHKLQDHINEVSELGIGRWWPFMIRVICPLMIGFIFVTTTVIDIRERIGENAKSWGPYVGQWALLVALFLISIVLMKYRQKEEVIE